MREKKKTQVSLVAASTAPVLERSSRSIRCPFFVNLWHAKNVRSHHLLLGAAIGALCAGARPCPPACSSGMLAAAVTAFMTMRPRGMMYIQYLAQKDFSGGFITSPSPLSVSINCSTNDGVLGAWSAVFRIVYELNVHFDGTFIGLGYWQPPTEP